MPPQELFDSAATSQAVAALDRAATLQHLAAYGVLRGARRDQWLFLNAHPASFVEPGALSVAELATALAAHGVRPDEVVVELLEASSVNTAAIAHRVSELKALGCLIALDDFGAGHSNFERVFELSPHIVKLDKSVLARSRCDDRARRVTAQMVSLLHECGALVLMEGIDTLAEAHTALACDADFTQGYLFGRPAADLVAPNAAAAPLAGAWDLFETSADADVRLWREAMAGHCAALARASSAIALGSTIADACGGFLALRGGDMCYLLDATGQQFGPAAFRSGLSHDVLGQVPQFAPMSDTRGVKWSRRKYFRDAADHPGVVQLTRAYLTLQGSRMCATASIRFDVGGAPLTLCGDVCVDQPRVPMIGHGRRCGLARRRCSTQAVVSRSGRPQTRRTSSVLSFR